MRFRPLDHQADETEVLLLQEQWAKEETKDQDTLEEGESSQPRPEKSNRLASAIDVAIFLLRLVVSFAVFAGNLHELTKREKATASFSNTFGIVLLLIDYCVLWIMAHLAVCRYWRLCCRLGCCRFYLWVLGINSIGAVCIGLPMHFVMRNLDDTWCAWGRVEGPTILPASTGGTLGI